MAQDGAKTGPRWPQDRPRFSQERPRLHHKNAPDSPKTAPDSPKTASDPPKTAPVRPKFGQVACKLPSCPPCCRQVAPRCLLSGLKPAKMPFCSHLGSLRGSKSFHFPNVFERFWAHRCFALRSLKIAQDGPKMAQDSAKTATRWPQDRPRRPKFELPLGGAPPPQTSPV